MWEGGRHIFSTCNCFCQEVISYIKLVSNIEVYIFSKYIGLTFFLLVTRYSLKFTCCSLLVAKFACYSLQKLLVAKGHSLLVTCYSLQKLLVAKNHSLLVAKFAHGSLEKLLVAKNHSLLVAKFTRCKIRLLLVGEVSCYKKSLVTCRKIRSLLVAEIARCKKLLVTPCRSCSLQKITRHSLWKNPGN